MQLVVGNWKMNGLREQAVSLARDIARARGPLEVRLAVAPPFPFLEPVFLELARAEAQGGEHVSLVAQDCAFNKEGAETGEVSPEMLASIGCRMVIVGHSERRAQHHETDEIVAKKLNAALRAGLSPIVCVGEVLADRDGNRHEEVVTRQVKAALAGLDGATIAQQIVLAYEPVWAIGTGRTATPAQAGEMHACIRRAIDSVAPETGEAAVVLYGGSVKPDNMHSLAAVPGVSGALVGGASLDAKSFLAIAAAAAKGEASRPKQP